MNIFDILAAIALVWAVVNGWRNGLVSQLFSIAGVIAGLVLGYYFGGRVGAMLGVEEKFAAIVGFIATFIGVLIVAAIASKLLRALFSLVGIGQMDTILGIALSVAKFALVLSVLFTTIESLNRKVEIVERRHFDSSKTFRPISGIARSVGTWLDNLSKEE